MARATTARDTTARDELLRVAVVGAGPAGLYTADALRRARDGGGLPGGLRVDVLDRLPAPFGLLRHGVAPDHLKIKKIAVALERVLADDDVHLLGDVDVGTDLTVADLRAGYDAVVVACGAAVDRRLGVPGEDLPGSVSSTSFVAWYSGHPDAALPAGLLATPEAVVVGVGNVAVDVARLLLRDADLLRVTDVPDDVLEALAASRVRSVTVLGRRGPAQATWTSKELRELCDLDGVDVAVDPAELELDPTSQALAEGSREVARCLEVLRDVAARPSDADARRRLRLRFFLQPEELLGGERLDGPHGRVAAVRCACTALSDDGRAFVTGERVDVTGGLVVRAIGYRGVAVEGLPFDARRGVVPSEAGRVRDGDAVVPGLYVSGWIRRGPTGVVGTNRSDASEVVASLVQDSQAGVLPEPSGPGAAELLVARGERPPVDLDGWRRLDGVEAEQGALRTAPRVKVADWEGLRAAARPSAGTSPA